MRLHIHAPPAKANALGFQPKPLLHRRIPAELDLSTSAQHALPRQAEALPQNRRHLPRRAGKSRGPRDCSIGRDLALRNRPNRLLDSQTISRDLAQLCSRLAKRFDGFAFRIVYVENRQQLGDLQQIAHALG